MFWKKKFPEKQMARIAQSLLKLATDRAVRSELPDLDQQAKNFLGAIGERDPSSLESALLTLYIRLHSAGATNSPSEKELLTKQRGYSCHPGGLSPLIMAEQFIRPESIVADPGAGNGLQGLLLQRLYPHQRTLLIELSSEMIRIGQIFQHMLGISSDFALNGFMTTSSMYQLKLLISFTSIGLQSPSIVEESSTRLSHASSLPEINRSSSSAWPIASPHFLMNDFPFSIRMGTSPASSRSKPILIQHISPDPSAF